MTAAPAGLRSYQDKDRSSRLKASLAQTPPAHKTNPTLQRLRTKLENGHIRCRHQCKLRKVDASESKCLAVLKMQIGQRFIAAAQLRGKSYTL